MVGEYQTIDNAFGLTVDMAVPTSLRRNDMQLLRVVVVSNLNRRFRDVQLGELILYIIMGDSAYVKRSHITSYRNALDLIPGARIYMKQVRISIEWNYEHTASAS
jgi:hypothetical protein